MIKCSNAQVLYPTKWNTRTCSTKLPKVPMFQYSTAPCSNVQMFQCSSVSMFQCSNVPLVHPKSAKIWFLSLTHIEELTIFAFSVVLDTFCGYIANYSGCCISHSLGRFKYIAIYRIHSVDLDPDYFST